MSCHPVDRGSLQYICRSDQRRPTTYFLFSSGGLVALGMCSVFVIWINWPFKGIIMLQTRTAMGKVCKGETVGRIIISLWGSLFSFFAQLLQQSETSWTLSRTDSQKVCAALTISWLSLHASLYDGRLCYSHFFLCMNSLFQEKLCVMLMTNSTFKSEAEAYMQKKKEWTQGGKMDSLPVWLGEAAYCWGRNAVGSPLPGGLRPGRLLVVLQSPETPLTAY